MLMNLIYTNLYLVFMAVVLYNTIKILKLSKKVAAVRPKMVEGISQPHLNHRLWGGGGAQLHFGQKY